MLNFINLPVCMKNIAGNDDQTVQVFLQWYPSDQLIATLSGRLNLGAIVY